MSEKVYQKDGITLYCGDCYRILGNEIKSFDCLITDPPYYTPAKISATRTWFGKSLGDYGILMSWFSIIGDRIIENINPKGSMYIFCDGKTYPLLYLSFYEHTKNLRPLIWDKKTSINGFSWRHQHEIIMFATMPQSERVPTGDGIDIDMIVDWATNYGQMSIVDDFDDVIEDELHTACNNSKGYCL